MLRPVINFFLISIRLLPLFYFLSLGLASIATFVTENMLGIYALTFRPFVYSLLMFVVLQTLSLKWFNWFNKYFWYGVSGNEPSKVIYLWLSVLIGIFGIAFFASGLVTVLSGSENSLSLHNIRDDIFYPAVATFLISPILMAWHISRKTEATQ